MGSGGSIPQARVMSASLTFDNLLAMGRAGDADRFIHLASAALAQHSGPSELLLLLAQRAVECGLARFATRVLASLSPPLRESAEVTALLRTLQACPETRISWDQFSQRFEANMQVLRSRYTWAESVAREWVERRDSLELHRSAGGRLNVLDLAGGGIGVWRPAFGNLSPQPSAEQFAGRFRGHILPPVVLEGVGLGEHLPWLYTATRGTFLTASAALYVIEHSLSALAAAMHLADWREPLADERVVLCAGPEACAQFERLIESDGWSAPPMLIVQAPPWQPQYAGRARAAVDRVALRHEQRRCTLAAEIRSLYPRRSPQDWGRRFQAALSGEQPPLRVLGLTSRFTTVLQYSMRDALRAFEAAGCRTHLLIEPSDHARLSPVRRLETIREFRPDLIFLIDHTRAGQSEGLVEGIPVVTWIQDRLPWLFDHATGHSLGPLDFCMGYGKTELVREYGYPAERFMSCAMATNPEALAARLGGPDAGEEDPELRCDLACATNHSQPPEGFLEEYRQRSEPAVWPLLEACYEALRARLVRGRLDGSLDCRHFLQEVETASGIELTAAVRARVAAEFVWGLADRMLRQETLEWAAQWAEQTGRRFHLYGRGWEKHPRFARFGRGYLEHGPRLGAAFRAARIHLHAGCNTALHQRVLDGLAAGGFFLIRGHGGDGNPAVSRAIYEHARRHGFRPGLTVSWRDLPAGLVEEFLESRRRMGVDPYAVTELTAGNMDELRAIHETATVPITGHVWPDFQRVTFDTREQLWEKLEWFLSHEQERRELASAMRQRVIETLSYEALIRRLLDWLVSCLLDPAPDAGPARHGAVAASLARE